MSIESNARTYIRRFPNNFIKGDGLYVYDDKDNKYLDFLACAGALPLGHNHPVTKKALIEYAHSDLPQQMLDMMTPAKQAYINEIKKWFPKGMEDFKIQFCSPSGSDAVEASLKLVRIATGRQMVISFSGGFHGQTMGALMCMGNTKVKKVMGLTNVYNHTLPFPNKYHWFDKEASEDEMINQSLEMIEQIFTDDESGIAYPAGIILECVQGEGGVVVAPPRWVKGLRAITKKYDVPLIADEVQSGFMRTGHLFAFNMSDIIPDVVICSKAAGGSQPLAFIRYHPDLDKWTAGAHTGTFRGNQIAFCTGKAVLEYLRGYDVYLNVNVNGNYLKEKLIKIQDKYPHLIHEVRGVGFMLGIQMNSGENAGEIRRQLFEDYKIIIELGGRHGSVVRVLCSLMMEIEPMNYLLQSFENILSKL